MKLLPVEDANTNYTAVVLATLRPERDLPAEQ